MDPSTNFMEFCRLCLDKDSASVPIFEGEGLDRNICMKIGSCLPVKVSNDDPLPKKICDDCTNKLDNFYSFWSTTANSEKQLLDWLSSKKNESEPFMEVVKTEMVTLKDESGDLDMSEVPAEVDESDPTEESQDTVDQRPAPDDSDEQSQGEEDTGGGSANDPPSEDATQASPSTSTTEAGPSGVQVPAASKPETATQSSLPQLPAQLNIVPTDSPRYMNSSENGGKSGAPSSSLKEACEVCGKRIISSFLKLHLRSHTGAKTYSCPVCDASCQNYKGLRSHMVSHSDHRPYTCEFCNRSFKRSNELTVHMRIHTGEKIFHCDLCDYSSVQKSNLVIHRKRHSNEYRFMCDLCDKGCYTALELHKHKMTHMDIIHKCKVCAKEFHHKYGLTIHEKKHDPNYEPPVGKFVCHLCGKRYVKEGGLKVHMRKHTGARPYTCEFCGKSVSSRSVLEDHVRTHTGEKPNICEVCGKMFSSKRYLDCHMRSHTGEKPFRCNECGKCFTQQSTLKIHIRYHTGERPFRCPICDKGFVVGTLLKAHQRSQNHFLSESILESEEATDASSLKDTGLSEHDQIEGSNNEIDYIDIELPEKFMFSCENCRKLFVDENILLAHQRRSCHGKQAVLKPEPCSDSE